MHDAWCEYCEGVWIHTSVSLLWTRPLNLNWIFPLTPQTGDENHTDPEVLRLVNVTHGHEGFYTCVAGNALGLTYASAYLRVVDGE